MANVVIVASWRSNRDPGNSRPQRVIAGCGAKSKKSNGQDQQQRIAPSPLSAGRIIGFTCTVERRHCRRQPEIKALPAFRNTAFFQ